MSKSPMTKIKINNAINTHRTVVPSMWRGLPVDDGGDGGEGGGTVKESSLILFPQ